MPRRTHIFKPTLSQGFSSVEKGDHSVEPSGTDEGRSGHDCEDTQWWGTQDSVRGTRGSLMLASKKTLIRNEEFEQTELQGQDSDN